MQWLNGYPSISLGQSNLLTQRRREKRRRPHDCFDERTFTEPLPRFIPLCSLATWRLCVNTNDRDRPFFWHNSTFNHENLAVLAPSRWKLRKAVRIISGRLRLFDWQLITSRLFVVTNQQVLTCQRRRVPSLAIQDSKASQLAVLFRCRF